jgi:hypothetical protein
MHVQAAATPASLSPRAFVPAVVSCAAARPHAVRKLAAQALPALLPHGHLLLEEGGLQRVLGRLPGATCVLHSLSHSSESYHAHLHTHMYTCSAANTCACFGLAQQPHTGEGVCALRDSTVYTDFWLVLPGSHKFTNGNSHMHRHTRIHTQKKTHAPTAHPPPCLALSVSSSHTHTHTHTHIHACSPPTSHEFDTLSLLQPCTHTHTHSLYKACTFCLVGHLSCPA